MREEELVEALKMRALPETSSTCPRCGSRLKDSSGRVLKCTRCGFTGDRDVIACVNLFYRYSRCGGLGMPLNAPKGDANPRPMRGNKEMKQ
ncbi:MAG: zinc ribbon domain-containing protein [Thermofilaceae archaeon]